MSFAATIETELKQLLLSGMTGDRLSYQRFLREISPLLRRIIGRKIPSADVEDVLQEVLLSIHKARHTYDGARALAPWLVAIARFRMNDHLRHYYAQMRHATIELEDFQIGLTDVTEPMEIQESISELLKGVPVKQQKILTMMHAQGYTAKEIGAHIGMNESAVKVAAHRAIKKIREKLTQ